MQKLLLIALMICTSATYAVDGKINELCKSNNTSVAKLVYKEKREYKKLASSLKKEHVDKLWLLVERMNQDYNLSAFNKQLHELPIKDAQKLIKNASENFLPPYDYLFELTDKYGQGGVAPLGEGVFGSINANRDLVVSICNSKIVPTSISSENKIMRVCTTITLEQSFKENLSKKYVVTLNENLKTSISPLKPLTLKSIDGEIKEYKFINEAADGDFAEISDEATFVKKFVSLRCKFGKAKRYEEMNSEEREIFHSKMLEKIQKNQKGVSAVKN